MHTPISTKANFEALILAAGHDLWDVQYLCLEKGADPNTLCLNSMWRPGYRKSSWGVFVEHVADQRKDPKFPWHIVMRNMVAFIKSGADSHVALDGCDVGKVVSMIYKVAKEKYKEGKEGVDVEDLKVLKKASPRIFGRRR
jgi:hypothetical protein